MLAPAVPALIAYDLVAQFSLIDVVSAGVFVVCFIASGRAYRKVASRGGP